MSRVNRASATDKTDCPDKLYQPTDGKIMAKAHFFQSRQNVTLNGVGEMRNELDEQAPAKAVKACIRARLAYLFIAEDELHQEAIKASLVKKIRKDEIKTDANKDNFEGNFQIPTGTRQNQ